jgi:hypothetical protein
MQKRQKYLHYGIKSGFGGTDILVFANGLFKNPNVCCYGRLGNLLKSGLRFC